MLVPLVEVGKTSPEVALKEDAPPVDAVTVFGNVTVTPAGSPFARSLI
jgi:hypothetical protein